WPRDFPGLYEKITRFCSQYGQFKAIEKRQKEQEQKIKKYVLEGIVIAYPLNKEGEKSKQYFRGGLTEVSREGCCFEIKSSKKETARALLAKSLSLIMSPNRSKNSPKQSITGRVERVSFHLHNDYSVYVTFHRPLKNEEFHIFNSE
ncbi:MAG: hypothetical protein GY705_03440, partial [Bacteroidetes bacterium]|nr:hypothetical protein [Bacteroidota bacterium]